MIQKPKRGLGRGFETLLSNDFDKSLLLGSNDRVEKLAVKSLRPNPQQPRHHFDDQALQGLADSIKQFGIVQPLVVSPSSSGKYTIIAGERRWRAAQIAGLDTVPALVRDSKELEQLEIALIENVQRVDLNAIDQAISIERLHQQFNFTYDQIAKRLGKATSTLSNIVRLLQLPEAARQALIDNKISEGHARALLALKDNAARQAYLLKTIIEQGWNVRQAERFVTGVKAGAKDTSEASKQTESETPATRQLSKQLNTPVSIRRTARGGKLEITFKSDEDLNRIINSFTG